MSYTESTTYESRIIAERIAADELGPVALHRISILTCVDGDDAVVRVDEETNDNNDDGYPDGRWDRWSFSFPNVTAALKHAGTCRVGISGVIVTVTLDGEEVR